MYTFAMVHKKNVMKKVNSAILILLLVLLAGSCKTDFDIVADWKDITVVYGLLDQRDSVQYIKINKAFLGEGDALMFAQEYDSSYYKDTLTVWVDEYNANQFVKRIYFEPTTTYKPEELGTVFPTGAQMIYKAVIDTFYSIHYIIDYPDTIGYQKIWLNENSSYRLNVMFPDSSKTVTSSTALVKDFEITKPFPGSDNIKFVTNPVYPTTFSWDKSPNDNGDFKYEIALKFYYEEVTWDGQVIQDTLFLASGSSYIQSGSNDLFFYYSDNNFFTSCVKQIPYEDPAMEANIKERHTKIVEITVSSAASDFNLFMQVYEPSTSIVQDKPPYTNIVNGIGIFSARYKKIITKKIHTETLNDLQEINNNFLKFTF
jgi:hypothetical protein